MPEKFGQFCVFILGASLELADGSGNELSKLIKLSCMGAMSADLPFGD